jgi:thiamine biosynthesis lipoprotein
LADAYATAVFVLGPEKGLDFIEKLPETEGLIVYQKEIGSDLILDWKVSKGIAEDIEIIDE